MVEINSREHGMRNGIVDLTDWDGAVILHVCGEVSQTKNEIYTPLGFLVEVADPNTNQMLVIDKARVLYKRPEPTHFEFDLPLIAIVRDDISFASDRLYAPGESYRVPAEGATRVSAGGVLGWSNYETKPFEHPYDLTYTVEVWARHKITAQQMLQIILSKVGGLNNIIKIVDSAGCERSYLIKESSMADLTQVNSLVDRVCGFSISFIIEGELTLGVTPTVGTAVTGPTQDTPINSDDPDPGSGGVYATGMVDVTLTPDDPKVRLIQPVDDGIAPGVAGFEIPPTGRTEARP